MGLGFVKIGVDAVVCEEGAVGAVLCNAAVVEDGGRLVEDDERGVFVEGAGDGGALGLAAGEVDTGAVVVVKAGAGALRELLYTVGETDFCKRGLQSSFINRSPCGDVFVERKGEQVEILENHGEGLGVLFVIVFADVDAV